MYSKIFKVFALLVVISMIVVPASAQAPVPPTDEVVSGKYQAVSPDDLISRDAPARYIVLFQGDSLVAQNGGAEGLDAKSTSSQAYLDTLATQRSAILADAEAVLGRSLMVRHVYDVILNGVSVELTPDEAAALAAMSGVRKVLRDTTEYLDTDAGPAWIGATSLWEGTAVPDGIGTLGEGILAGIIDSGINFDHPSFSDTPADGFTYEWTGDYLGVCAPGGDPEYADACNDKLVGAYSYTYDAPSDFVTPEDSDGHGSHTASTVTGNTVDLDFYGTPVTISGVAPHAQVISYDVCYPTPSGGQCAGEDSVAAVQQAILDGVDVINYSISGGENPYSDAVELAFLEAFDAGVVVSTSAGNAGPDAATVAHRSPWVLSTAASTHNRKFTSEVNFSNPLYQGITTLAGEIPFTTPVVEGNVKYAGEDGNPLGCADPGYTDNFYDGAIALIRRGTCTFSEKINTAAAAGASGVLIFTDDRAPGAMSVSGTTIPGVMLDIPGTFGQEIADWVAAQTDETVDISAFDALHSDEFGDIMADFSSRGPNTTFDLLKPDVSAPGMEILAAVSDGVIDPDGEAEFDLLQGTSMSSPHDAGAAALLYALHPDWTPAEIKSALMLTAYDGLLKEDKTTPADPFDMGAGRIQLELAGLTGLVMDETTDNMLAADPAEGGDVKTLNIASLYNSSCVGECSWTRTFTSVADLPATYTVSAPEWITVDPAEFTIAPGAAQEITITADVSSLTPDEWVFGNIEFLTDDTHPGTVAELLSEDFEVWPPAGWTIDADPASCDTWLSTADTESDNNTGGTGLAADANSDFCGDAMNTWMISPEMDFSGYDTLSLQFKSDFWDYLNQDDGYVDISVDGGTTWTNVFHYEKQDFYGPRTENVDLTAYAGETTVTIRFHYVAPDYDWWWQVDDVVVSATGGAGAPISDVAIPAAVLPAAGNLPDLVKFETHRDTGGDTLTDLVAVEITDLTVDTYGFVKGVPTELQLAKDPTNGSPYDNLSQVYYTLIPMDAGAARVVAEITASTAPDVDLYWGFDVNEDGLPQEDEEYENSATATAFEYVSDWGFPVGFYDVWVLVQNWQGSGAATDDITLSLGVVPWEPVDPPTMTVIGPETNEPGVPFALDILWHDVDTEEGDRLYGLMDVYADAAYEVGIGITEVDVVRGADDVIKTADVETAGPGDVITYTIEITNYTTEPIEYAINDVLPDGVTYVPDSVTGGAVYDELTNAITWDGFVDASYRDYVAATSAEDPNCTLAIMADGDTTDDYLDWETTSYGFLANPSISGDSFWYGTFSTYDPFNFYGVDYTGMDFTADGVTGWPNAVSAANTIIPDPTEPNNMMAIFWDDFIVQYDADNNYGVSLVGDGESFATIEYDDVQLKADTTKTLDMEVGYFLQPDDAPGMYEIIFAYDNITPGLFAAASGTIGVENADGTVGTLFSYNDTALEIADGSAICFDWALLPAPPKVITFQVTVDEGGTPGPLTNVVLHDNNQIGTVEESAQAVVELVFNKYIWLPVIVR
ncbi:MAG TPA: S8 family serine peptidase [Anaerolineaceae bacterium]|nr:S8 family serine peptidase [Anaerolineaceae bacterium]